jgi:hypothetical protein
MPQDPTSSNRRQFLATTGLVASSALADSKTSGTPRPVPAARATSGDRIEPDWKERLTITVGPKKADLVGSDDKAIQAGIDLVTRLGGGTVRLLAGTYRLRNGSFCSQGCDSSAREWIRF